MKIIFRGVAGVFALAVALTAPAGAPAAGGARAKSPPAEVSISNTRRIDFVSKVNGRSYSITVALPETKHPPAKGYPVLYVLDGYGYFATATEAVRANAPNVMVVGIGYPETPSFIDPALAKHRPLPAAFADETPFDTAVTYARTYDLTQPATAQAIAHHAYSGMPLVPADTGGLDDFLKTIETEVKPRVAALAPVNKDNQVLFGHSLGGSATLHALLTEPTAFRTFIAASPSIWWADRLLLADEAKFAAQVTSGAVKPRILITVGAEEQEPPKLPATMTAAMKAEIAALSAKARMVDNARELAS